ncbi:MAG: hypothetical protein A2X64_03300 [Ignavibacteria bacterium GWF2_33_9]|nr:MAG: hypothetical protein A2X64_03300 [Ignavibacteria bacterium GWF2_33_9]
MKKILLIVFILTASMAVWAVSSTISTFRAFSNGANITVQWSTTDESNLKGFEIQRSGDNSAFKKVASVDANGKISDYKYVDEDALLKQGDNDPQVQSGKIYSYRIKSIFNDGNEELSESISVTHQTNSIRRTWGMIKELFR